NGHFTSILAIRIPLIKTGSLSDDHRIEYVTHFYLIVFPKPEMHNPFADAMAARQVTFKRLIACT
ncbi:MAG: hypothetical protein ACH344_09420, partial [Yersinia sp. (in: enterobacteria)]